MTPAMPAAPERQDSVGSATVAAAMVGLGWRRLRRDPVGLIFTFVMPLAIAVVMGAIYMAEASGPAAVGVVADASDPVAGDLVARLDANPLVEIHVYRDRAALDRAVRRRAVDAGLVVPSGLGAALDGQSIELVGPPGVAAPDGLRAAVEITAAETTAAVQLGAVLEPGDPLGAGLDAARARLADGASRSGVDDGRDGRGDQRRDFAGNAVFATLVLFVFVNTAGGASAWAELRELGVVGRLRSTTATSGALAWGLGLYWASFAVVESVIVLAIGRAVFDLPVRSPAAVVAVLAATAVAAGGLAVLVATVLPSSASGTTVAGPIAFVLAMLGGCLWPLEIVPSALATAGRATPHLWAVDGLQDSAVGGAELVAVGGSVAVLVAIGLVAGVAGGRRVARDAGGV
jgi:ABC-2 type transport system permease protein